MQSALLETTKNSLEDIAKTKGAEIELYISNNLLDLQIVAKNPVLMSSESSPEEIESELKKITEIYSTFDDLSVVNLDGHVIASVDHRYRGEWSTKQWFIDARDGNVSMSNVHTIPDPLRTVLVFTAPVFNERNEIQSVVALQISMEEVWNRLKGTLTREGSYAILVDENGRILYHPNREALFSDISPEIKGASQENFGFFTFEQEGDEWFSGYQTVGHGTAFGHGPWKIYIVEKREVVFKLFEELQNQTILFFVITSMLMVFIGLVLSIYITRPIEKLKKATKKYAEGEFDYTVDIYTRDEMHDLGKSFNDMALQIKKSKDFLEKEVDRRTSELREKNAELMKTNKLMVGRELKMVELKKMVQECERKKGSQKKQK
ncbi:HAMP domain-containing protein [Patescibacteria group bacterium]|nr:HAMP domain-containing protein [Patescibacteria group bacterium]